MLTFQASKVFRISSAGLAIQKCEEWSNENRLPNVLTDDYDGKIWSDFMVVNGKPFLKDPYKLSLRLNIDWFQPFDHTQYSMGAMYLAIDNLTRTERFKVQNVIIVGCIPGPTELKQDLIKLISRTYG